MRAWLFGILVLITFVLAGCTRFSVESRVENADLLAEQEAWEKQILHTEYFVIRSYVPRFEKGVSGGPLTIYFEGDGLAWISRTKPSSNPTPINPLALSLAMKDQGRAAYLGRPCQYVVDKHCSAKYWTSERFAPEVVDSMNDAVSQLKAKMQASRLVLVGYSGGGAIAALVAARRGDVVSLITIAGNLDPQKWTQEMNVSPLIGSLNPADEWKRLMDIPQLHLVGEEDTSVPLFVAESYQSRFPQGKKPAIKVVEGFDHHCCWLKEWPALKQ